MERVMGPIDEEGCFRRSQCSFLKSNDADSQICGHERNSGKLCTLADCPIVEDAQRRVEQARRNLIRHTPPTENSPNISFPDQYAQGRIRLPDGTRLLDWEGSEWKPYTKDGVRWWPDELTDRDYETLYECLQGQISALFP